jgi:hypothetical protein
MRMDSNTQQNAALVEEAATASRAIVDHTEALSVMIARYTVSADAVLSSPETFDAAESRGSSSEQSPAGRKRAAAGG